MIFRHEHLYEEIQQKVIRSDELPKDIGDMARMFGDTRIVLCTLSMMSNPALRDIGAFEIIPVERLVIDEASQINTFEYLVRSLLCSLSQQNYLFMVCQLIRRLFLKLFSMFYRKSVSSVIQGNVIDFLCSGEKG